MIITVNGVNKEYAEGTTYEQIALEHQKDYDHVIALAEQDHKIYELMKKVKSDGEVKFLTIADKIGHQAYVRTATMMMIKAVRDVLGAEHIEKLKVEFSVGPGLFCTIKSDIKIDRPFIEKVATRMHEMVEEKLPIKKMACPLADAVKIFEEQNDPDKVLLFKYRRYSRINVYELDGYYDYFYGYMLPNTSYVPYFDLISYREGILLVLPSRTNPEKITEFASREKVVTQMMISTNWGNRLGIDNVGDLNEQICTGDMASMILVQEALQERRIGELAENIYNRRGVKFVMIAGPSSSGKTTFANRLSIQLRTYGLKPHLISLDNYFLNRTETPRDENGNYNFECLEAIDVEQFNKDMTALLKGEKVELPTFNFLTGEREMNGDYMKLNEEDILVIEGIHGLNEKMSYALPAKSKYRIYISALASLNVDSHNRIRTTDARLLRRIVRDARTRGATARHTIAMWESVRRGEEEYIFPFQESADEVFNSAQIYEIAVIKPYTERLLFDIEKGEPEYYEAKRLIKLLDYVVGMDSTLIPMNSICREFIGGSCFKV